MKRFLVSAAVALLGFAGAAFAQFPNRPVTMLVPYAAGGPTDTIANILAPAMGKPLAQSIVVEVRPSAGGVAAAESVANAKPDGYSILIHHIGMAVMPALYRHLRFQPLTDYEYIGLILNVPMTLVARQNYPARDFKEFLAHIKANRNKVTYANAGVGSASHLCGMLFMSAIRTNLLTVPYKGTMAALNDVLSGQVDFMCYQTSSTTAQIKSGTVKVYGATSLKRVPSLPDIPTLDEQGLKGFEVGVWYGLYAPRDTPTEAIDKLVAALQAALKDPIVNQRFAELGGTAYPADKATPAALQAHLKAEVAKWTPIIKKAGVYAD